MIDEIQEDASTRMDKSLVSFEKELSKLRTGRAHPSLLDHLTVDYFGSPTPLKQVANIIIEDSRTLAVSPWEKDMVKVIEKAIMTANLGLNPNTAGTVIRIPMPPLTEERRVDIVKVARHEAEGARVAVRNIRRDANGDLKEMTKEKMISEDDEHRGQDLIQKLTDSHVKKIDGLLAIKEKDLMEM